MRRAISNIWRLGIKEMRGLRADPVLLIFMAYVFTIAVYMVSAGMSFDVSNAAVAIVDEDRSPLSGRIANAIQPPYFKPPVEIGAGRIDAEMDRSTYVFVIEIPPRFEQDILAGRRPAVQINIDATAMATAGNGANYLQNIIGRETLAYLTRNETQAEDQLPVQVELRRRYNKNGNPVWFMAVMQVINNITILSVILTGAALIREREHGTIEHLLVMPVTPFEIMLAKIWANGLTILIAAFLSLVFVVGLVLNVPVAGSKLLFGMGALLYMFSVTALGILIATFSTSMPQFGLLAMPVLIVLNLLSGSTTPLESMPDWLQFLMQGSPATQFVAFAQAVLFRDAGLIIVWPYLAALALIGGIFLGLALLRFKRMLARMA